MNIDRIKKMEKRLDECTAATAKLNRQLDRVEAAARIWDCTVSHLDGVRLEFPDGWILLRKSVTAGQITIRAEAGTRERLEELIGMVKGVLPEADGI